MASIGAMFIGKEDHQLWQSAVYSQSHITLARFAGKIDNYYTTFGIMEFSI